MLRVSLLTSYTWIFMLHKEGESVSPFELFWLYLRMHYISLLSVESSDMILVKMTVLYRKKNNIIIST